MTQLKEWLNKRLRPTYIDNIDLDTIASSDRSVVIAPEGYGKSRNIISDMKKDKSKYFVFSTHTKVNALEKSLVCGENAFHVKSDSELFVNMVSYISSSMGELLSKTDSYTQNYYIDLFMFSCKPNNPESLIDLKEWTDKKYKEYIYNNATHFDNKNGFYEYNFAVYGKLLKQLSKLKDKTYYLFVKKVFTKEELLSDKTELIENFKNLIINDPYMENKACYTNYTDKISFGYDSCYITKKNRAWLSAQKTLRDNTIKQFVLNAQSGIESPINILVSQNRTTDNYIAPAFKKVDVKYNKCTLIHDEIMADAFIQVTTSDINRVIDIVKRVKESKDKVISYKDERFIKDLGYTKEFKRLMKSDDNDVDILNIHNPQPSIPMVKGFEWKNVSFSGETELALRFRPFSKIICLTSEYLQAVNMRMLGFKVYECQADYRFKDDNLNICISSSNTKTKVITSDETDKSNITNMINNCRLNKSFTFGVSSYGTQMNMDNCKGLNIDFSNYEKIVCVKNPTHKSFYTHNIKNFVALAHNRGLKICKSDIENIINCSVVDQINQLFGRFSGYRNVDIPKYFLIHDKDSLVMANINNFRYSGVSKNFDDIYEYLSNPPEKNDLEEEIIVDDLFIREEEIKVIEKTADKIELTVLPESETKEIKALRSEMIRNSSRKKYARLVNRVYNATNVNPPRFTHDISIQAEDTPDFLKDALFVLNKGLNELHSFDRKTAKFHDLVSNLYYERNDMFNLNLEEDFIYYECKRTGRMKQRLSGSGFEKIYNNSFLRNVKKANKEKSIEKVLSDPKLIERYKEVQKVRFKKDYFLAWIEYYVTRGKCPKRDILINGNAYIKKHGLNVESMEELRLFMVKFMQNTLRMKTNSKIFSIHPKDNLDYMTSKRISPSSPRDSKKYTFIYRELSKAKFLENGMVKKYNAIKKQQNYLDMLTRLRKNTFFNLSRKNGYLDIAHADNRIPFICMPINLENKNYSEEAIERASYKKVYSH
jgi:hypothetical protein